MEKEGIIESEEKGIAQPNSKIFSDRTRTNILRKAEQKLIAALVKKVPRKINSDMLTVVGLVGSFMVLISFLSAAYIHRVYLLSGIGGLVVNWIGDSLDGRLAYYRNIPRKWYGFALDIIMDWISIVLIGFGYLVYADGYAEILAFLFVVLYGWAMIISQIRYKITGAYTIDSGLLGPTELRVVISVILIAEVYFKGSIIYAAAILSSALFAINIVDTRKLLMAGDFRDREERKYINHAN